MAVDKWDFVQLLDILTHSRYKNENNSCLKINPLGQNPRILPGLFSSRREKKPRLCRKEVRHGRED